MSLYNSRSQLLNSYGKKVVKNIHAIELQEKEEYEFYLSTKINNLSNLDVKIINNIDDEALAQQAKYKFFNADIMELMGRYTKIIIHLADDPDNNHSALLKDIFTNLNKIGTESVEGNAIVSGLKNIKDMFILKIPRNSKENLLHEFYVGNHLNTLRSNVSNFAYIYGAFNCNFPLFIENNVLNFCSTNSNIINYIIYENIYDSVTIKKFAETCNFEEFLNVFLQIILTLNYANKKLEFVHYDLHNENVLIRKLDHYVTLVYPYKNKYLYIKTKNIPFIIDYGFSRIKVNGKIFSYNAGLIRGNINYSDYNPLFDPFKLLTSLLYDTNFKNYNEGIYDLMKFFVDVSDEEFKNIIIYLKEKYFEPPDLLKGNNEDYIEYIMNNFDLSSSFDDADFYNKYSCVGLNKCQNKEEILNSTVNLQKDLYIFYKIYNEISKGIIKKEHEELFNKYLDSFKNDINESWKVINDILNKKSYDISELNNINNIDLDILNLIKQDFINKYKLSDYYDVYMYKLKIIYAILTHFGKLDMTNKNIQNDINQVYEIINIVENNKKKYIDERLKIINNNIKKLQELSTNIHYDYYVERRLKEDLELYKLYK